MKKASSLSHPELYAALRNGDLDPESFDHEAHIRLAWYYLSQQEFDPAAQAFGTDFYRFIVRAGAQSKYHKTITCALLQLIASHLDDERCKTDWEYFKRDAEPLFANALGLLKRFYSEELLFSDDARKHFIHPDLSDFP